jgi:hypothetical protein
MRPENGSQVSVVTLLEGTVADPDANVWIVVHPLDTSAYWVQPRVTTSDRRWTGLAFFGRSGDVDAGKAFEVRAFLAPFDTLREGDILGDWPDARGVSAPLAVRRQPAAP